MRDTFMIRTRPVLFVPKIPKFIQFLPLHWSEFQRLSYFACLWPLLFFSQLRNRFSYSKTCLDPFQLSKSVWKVVCPLRISTCPGRPNEIFFESCSNTKNLCSADTWLRLFGVNTKGCHCINCFSNGKHWREFTNARLLTGEGLKSE